MGLLGLFEKSMERLVEGTVGTVFRQSITPAEIARKLQRSMDANARPSVNSAIVPNAFTVGLNPKDYAQFASFPAGLAREMESLLVSYASERRYTAVDRIRVTIEEDETARRRDPSIHAEIHDSRTATPVGRRDDPADRTQAFQVVERGSFVLQVTGGVSRGNTFHVPEGSSTIGRSSDNALVIDAPDVSRKHARLERSAGRLRIYDLNSTNGTRVNGDPVRIADLLGGEEIRLGNQVLAVRRSERR
jgi:hypothetical protein